MAKWWVNDPNGQSVHYPTKQRAQNVARQVKGAKVSHRHATGGKHKAGCLPLIALVVGLLIAICFI